VCEQIACFFGTMIYSVVVDHMALAANLVKLLRQHISKTCLLH